MVSRMIDWLVSRIFAWDALRAAIIEEVHMYDYLYELLADDEGMKIESSFWNEGDGWRSWHFDEDRNVYVFNDIPTKNLLQALEIENV